MISQHMRFKKYPLSPINEIKSVNDWIQFQCFRATAWETIEAKTESKGLITLGINSLQDLSRAFYYFTLNCLS